MSKSGRRAGQNIRKLAVKRRAKAIASFASAGLLVVFPLFLARAFEVLFKEISSISSSQQPSSPKFSLIVYALFVISALGLVANGAFLWKRANHAAQGAKGEEEIAQVMLQLEKSGWQVEYGTRLEGGLGDADVICVSPQNNAYVIDVKSHRGEVIADGKQLLRRMGRLTYLFEKNFLSQAMRQAFQVRNQKNLSFVTPVVAFSNAKVSLSSNKLKGVYVVEKSRLVLLLSSLG